MKEFVLIMNRTLKESNYPNKHKLFDKVMRQQIRAYKYYKNISLVNLKTENQDEALKNLGIALFKSNISHLRNINTENKYMIKNKIIVCEDCYNKTENNIRYYKKTDNDTELKNNFIQYLQDINRAIKQDKLHVNSNYINSVIKHVKYSSTDRIALNQADYMFLKYKTYVSELPFENQEGIPCPKCNGIMLTHNQTERLTKRIVESETIKDLAEIVKEYRNSFPPITKMIADRFLDNYIRDPYITDTLMKKDMIQFSRKLAQQEMFKFINNLQKHINDPNTPDDIKPDMKNLRDNLYQYNRKNNKFYQIKELRNLFSNSRLKTSENTPWFEEASNDFLLNIEILQAPAFHSEEITNIYKSWSKIFLQRIIHKSVLTKDHMIARINGGTDEPDNTMALHKECNMKKDKKDFKKWFEEDPKTQEYTKNYLKKIDELSADGKVEDCEDYSQNISNKIETLTGKNKLKTEFDKK